MIAAASALGTAAAAVLRRMGWKGIVAASVVAAVLVGLRVASTRVSDHLQARETAAFERGRAVGLRASVVDSLMRAHAIERQRWAVARTDSAAATLRRTQRRVAPAIAALPPEVKQLPSVQLLVSVTTQLVADSDSSMRAGLEERAAHRLRQTADSARIAAQDVVITISNDSLRVLERELARRPTWTQTAIAMVAAGIAGFLGGIGR